MPYQTFQDTPGDSNSIEKLKRLGLPENMTGLSFLDLGCNEGFFCSEAYMRGARKVIGLDANHHIIGAAKSRFSHLDFRVQSWRTLPEGPFDIILLASGLHYESQPYELMREIFHTLSDRGVFILEAGVISGSQKLWVKVQRAIDTVLFPTLALMIEDLLSPFSARPIAFSVQQEGDPVPRVVFHCRKFRPIVLLAPGPSGTGKTTLAVELSRGAVMRYSTDSAIEQILKNPYHPRSRLWNLLVRNGCNNVYFLASQC